MTEEQFTDEQGNIVTKKVGAESPLNQGEARRPTAKGQAGDPPPSQRAKHGSAGTVQGPWAPVLCDPDVTLILATLPGFSLN